jgi:hypothetical protein
MTITEEQYEDIKGLNAGETYEIPGFKIEHSITGTWEVFPIGWKLKNGNYLMYEFWSVQEVFRLIISTYIA